MHRSFFKDEEPDGEIAFLAADPDYQGKGIGSALLKALEKDEKGKLVYLYTDNACSYGFYEHRGFLKAEQRRIVLDLGKKQVPLTCLLYVKRL